eukprot:12896322-Prorocentrum_lima.AAC.1
MCQPPIVGVEWIDTLVREGCHGAASEIVLVLPVVQGASPITLCVSIEEINSNVFATKCCHPV